MIGTQPYELKSYISENNKLIEILEDLGCHNIKIFSKEYRCGLPNHNNKTSVSIKIDTLSVKIYQSDSNIIRGDIFVLVMTIKKLDFFQSNKYLHNLLKLEFKINKNKTECVKKDPLDIFKKIRKKTYIVNKDNIDLQDNSILKEYTPLPYIEWIREGIMPWTCDKFKIGYSADRKRIIIPHRYWSGSEDEFVGIIGRTTIKEWEMLDIPKYFPIKSYPKGMNLYGLQENYESIQRAEYVVIYEAEKSVLKRHSRMDETGVAICCHDFDSYDEQVKILIGLDVDIIIAMDKGISLNHIRSMCEKFYGIRTTYYIYDKHNLLKDKESPADAPNKIYNYLLKYKIKYDEKEHNQYLKECKII